MSGNESPPKRELPWTDVEVAMLRCTFPTLSASAPGRLPTSPDPRRLSPRLPGGDIAVLRAGFLARVADLALDRLTRRRANSEL